MSTGSPESDLQGRLWSFISLYRRYSGHRLSYIELTQNPALLRQHLDSAHVLGAAELTEAAERLEAALGEPVAAAPVRAPAKATMPAKPASAERDPLGVKARAVWAEDEYIAMLETALADGVVSVAERADLDQFCRRQRITAERASALESQARERLGLAELSWIDELRSGVRSLQGGGFLSERDRLQLFETYLKKGRLSVRHAEQVLEDERPAAPAAARGRSNWPRLGLAAAAVLIVATAALVLLEPGTSILGLERAVADAARQPKDLRISGSILEPTVWRAGTVHHLDGIVFVEGGAKLTIEPGVRIVGGQGSALVVTRDASLYARGTADAPIVFTSSKPAGQRFSGDWGGVVLLGNAPVNRKDAHIEGIAADDIRGRFGGSDQSSNCGVLEYARIEFAGHEVFANNELNGLTLGGCGDSTIIRNVQVHRALDDGIEVFGGDVDLKNIVITGAGDDSLDWDMGWTGRVQFLVAQQHADRGDNGFEADNAKKNHNAQPRSEPTLYNVTLIGGHSAQKAQRAMTLRLGTGGHFHNFIVSGFSAESIDIRDRVSAALADTGELSFSHMLMHAIGANGSGYFQPEAGEQDDDNGFDEAAYFAARERKVHIDLDPRLPVMAKDPLNPLFTPAGNSPAALGAATAPQEEFWDQAATYLGAIRPGALNTWLDRWTAYPAN